MLSGQDDKAFNFNLALACNPAKTLAKLLEHHHFNSSIYLNTNDDGLISCEIDFFLFAWF